MEPYLDKNGTSGVAAYEIGCDFIRVQFKDKTLYLYTDAITGADNVRQMKHLAGIGKGLNTFINRFIKDRYAEKEH